ncbi:MAG TPA: hypothetical protein VMG55_19220 [Stellaceae bacterium]|nr:hypothetical protein [Stellaceae bacterium]
MRRGRLLLLPALLAGFCLVFAARAEHASGEREALTPHYRIVLQIGPAEAMYTPTEARLRHPDVGEIMLGGRLSAEIGGLGHEPAGGPVPDERHLELHVVSRATGKVVAEAHVTIAIAGPDKRWNSVPVARMYGIEAGPDDLHYGNNVRLPPGAYSVRASVNGERAGFSVTLE